MNQKVQSKAKEVLGRTTSFEEIEMMKFVMVRLTFQVGNAKPMNTTIEENRLYKLWKKEGRVTKNDEVTPEFWKAMTALIWERYGNTLQ